MMSVSNGFVSSDNNEKKRSLENGCSPTKWKARKVSATRDFPPGCGPSSPPPASVATDDKVETLKANQDFPPGCGPNNSSPVSPHPQEVVSVAISAGDKVEALVVYADGVPVAQVGSLPHESVKSYPQADEPPTDVKFSEAEIVNGSTNDHDIRVPEEVFVKKEFQNGDIQASSEVNGSGAECQASVKEEVHHETQIMVESERETEKKTMLEAGCGMADAGLQVGVVQPTSPPQVTVTDQVGVVQPTSPPQVTVTESKTTDGSPPKNKYRRRRVSAVRDFPPYCGWNAPEPPEAERLKILGNKGSASSDEDNGVCWRSAEQVIVGSDDTEGSVSDEKVSKNEPKTGPEPKLKSHAVIQDSDKGGRNEVGQKIVAYNRVRINRGKSSVAEFGDKGKSLSSKDAMIAPSKVSKGNVGNKEALNSKAEDIRTDPRYRSCDASEELNGVFQDDIVLKSESEMIVTEPKNRSHAIVHERDKHIDSPLRKMDREKSRNTGLSDDNVGLGCTSEDMMTVLGLMAAPYCPWRPAKGSPAHPDVSKSSKKKRLGSVTPKNSMKIVSPHGKSSTAKHKSSSSGKGALSTLDLMVKNEETFFPDDEEQRENSPAAHGLRDFDVSLPPFGPKSTTDDRNKVREILRLYQAICRKLLQTEEARMREGKQGKELRRIDLAAAKILKDKGKEVNPGIKMVGAIPGVEIGDEFQYRVELAIVGVHRLYQAGIDYLKQGEQIVATSIVASGGYDDDLENPNCLIYSGSGGVGKDKQHEDQKLERGNLALKNSISVKNPVRVIRGAKGTRYAESSDARAKMVITYVYDGLYTVERYWQDPGPNGTLHFKFELKRIPGQPELALKEVKRSKKFKTREGRCVDDISGGKEPFPICAVNTIDNEKPPPFNYINEIIYPDWYQPPLPSGGCDCKGPCSDNRCPCAIKNGGEIPYNHNGAIVEIKPLVYECGKSCKCPPSCYNRVTQYGMKIQLEIFKTESRGWGVRSLNSISSGSFICEYIGELLEDREAEKRTGNDEYLFDIGQNYADCSVNADANPSSNEFLEDGGFTIDAANSGNVGRFINHSCSPNLYAQNVLYDQEDKRMPHIMFFAAENIPPLQELTYHYNYKLDTVFDAYGNVKIKHCYCGSTECTGRMY